ncbi:hypothetical protein QUF61_07795 [Candidatus Venteria ishoeyi]|uniref:hypothetical protein n=1 Tax=Candidatus Venteria ishoeyi TaxID=1899563 RepID=UPI0025A60CE7|nr:hypothetical protein [Candidatus Venteria ishoeyi]MDM8546382.1 hypothetical protein [Candidatus Venteria ishoeyi]
MANISPYLTELENEIHQVPAEFLPLLLSIVKSYRQSLQLMSAEDSFKQGWQETKQGETYPLADLWEDID